jgi:hypothetical protein
VHFAANELEKGHQSDVARLRLRRTPTPTNADNCVVDRNGTQLPCGYRSRSVRDGPVNIRRSSTSTGVRKSDNKKVPKKPMRR